MGTTAAREGNVRVYTLHGDLVIPDETVIKGSGRLGVAFRAANNVFIGQNVTWGPTLGFDPACGAFEKGLAVDGWMNDPAFGGLSDAIILGQGGLSVFATLIPEVDGLVTAGGSNQSVFP